MKATLIIFAVFFVVVDQFALLNAGTIFFLKNSCKRVMKNGIQAQNYFFESFCSIYRQANCIALHHTFSFIRKSNFWAEAELYYLFIYLFCDYNALIMFLFHFGTGVI